MTFVIKEKIENNDAMVKTNHFDVEPYNYIFNKSTSFLDGEFTSNNQVELQKVLENMYKLSPDYLELLNYTQDVIDTKNPEKTVINSVLHQAHRDSNFRCIETLLHYLTFVQKTDS